MPRLGSLVFLWPRPCLYGGSCKTSPFSNVFRRFQAGCHVVLRGRCGTLWHSNLFDNVSKVVWCGRRNTFASLSEDELQFSWQALHCARVRARHSTLYTSTLYTLHSTLYTPHSTLHTPHSTLHTPHSTLYALDSTLHILPTLYTPHSTIYTLHFTLYTLHSTLYTLNSALYTPHFTLYTPHSTLYTPHFTLYTPHFTLEGIFF